MVFFVSFGYEGAKVRSTKVIISNKVRSFDSFIGIRTFVPSYYCFISLRER